MNAFSLTKEQLLAGLAEARTHNIDGNAYGQAMMWNLLQFLKANGRSEADLREEVGYALDNLDDDSDFHVSRN